MQSLLSLKKKQEISDLKKEKSTKKSGESKFFRFFRIFFAGIVGAVLHIKVVGGENEPQKGGYLVCANHISATDPICLCYAFKKNQVHFMAKKELFGIPVISGLIRLLGAFPVDRSGSDVGAIKTAISLVGDGGCLGIFPQGHRYPGVDPSTTPTKNGAALIAYKSESDILPVFIKTKGNKYAFLRKIEIIFGEPIKNSALGFTSGGGDEYKAATDKIFGEILKLGDYDALVAPQDKENKD